MPTFRIRFLPDGQEIAVDQGKSLLDAARTANVYVGREICGGEGTCGKCRLIVREGEVAGRVDRIPHPRGNPPWIHPRLPGDRAP